jgi:hypothetical protein
MQTKTAVFVIFSVIPVVALAATPALARGGHGHALGRGGMHMHGAGGGFAGGRRHGDDAAVKAAAAENDRLLNNKIKSICRGC